MKKLAFLILLIVCACNSKPSPTAITNINGYWEIDEVVFEDGNKKKYEVNDFIEYYEIKNNNGFRQKIKPQLDGTLMQTPLKDKIIIKDSADFIFLKTKTNYTKFEDKLIEITEDKLVIENQNKAKYYYKKFIPYAKR